MNDKLPVYGAASRSLNLVVRLPLKTLTLPLVTMFLLLISACAGVGIVSTEDPLAKLNDAEVLIQQKNRPVPAEKLIQEAIAIYQSTDDLHGLGNAYREYGDLLRSFAVVRWEPQYRRYGFLDKSITFDNRLVKATDFYGKALESYERAVPKLREAGRYDALTNVYFNMAWSHRALEATAQACADFDHTVEAYTENMKRNPSAKSHVPAGFSSLPDAIAHAKQEAGCPSS